MQKVDGIREVKVSLKEGLTVLDLKPPNRVTLAKLREIIKNNGFVSKEAAVIANGTLKGGLFEVSATGEQLSILGKPVSVDQGWRFVSPAK